MSEIVRPALSFCGVSCEFYVMKVYTHTNRRSLFIVAAV